MKYIVDTDIFIYFLNKDQTVFEKMKTVGEKNMYISSLTVAELYFGAYHSNFIDKNIAVLDKYLPEIKKVDFISAMASIFGKNKEYLIKKGLKIGEKDTDLYIASIALFYKFTLVTNNEKHFRRIPDLKVENWKK